MYILEAVEGPRRPWGRGGGRTGQTAALAAAPYIIQYDLLAIT